MVVKAVQEPVLKHKKQKNEQPKKEATQENVTIISTKIKIL